MDRKKEWKFDLNTTIQLANILDRMFAEMNFEYDTTFYYFIFDVIIFEASWLMAILLRNGTHIANWNWIKKQTKCWFVYTVECTLHTKENWKSNSQTNGRTLIRETTREFIFELSLFYYRQLIHHRVHHIIYKIQCYGHWIFIESLYICVYNRTDRRSVHDCLRAFIVNCHLVFVCAIYKMLFIYYKWAELSR